MGYRPASSKATRGAHKGIRPQSSSSSNPKSTRFRSQYNSLGLIAKGAPSKKSQNKDAIKQASKDAVDRKRFLDSLDHMTMLDDQPNEKNTRSVISHGSKKSTASFASVWSNCSNSSLTEFFEVWNPNLATHKDALSVIAGLSQIMSANDAGQSDMEFTRALFSLIDSVKTPRNILTGALLALTFVIRNLKKEILNENFDSFYPVLKKLITKYHDSGKKTIVKSLIRCFACLSKAHVQGKNAIEPSIRKIINVAIRQCKVQDKLRL